MKTEILKIDPLDNGLEIRRKIKYAAQVIRNGGLVAFPTETVYGLGADAFNAKAVEGIFKAKGRPADNPLISHISDVSQIDRLVSGEVPPVARVMMEQFWPGPLTLIMNKAEAVPGIVTAGLGTAAVRMPSHPVALALIEEAGTPVAAPSANSSGKPSPTSAAHVISDLSGKVDVIVDSGASAIGLESTVVDVTVHPPVILRPGWIHIGMLAGLVPGITYDRILTEGDPGASTHKPRSPGMKYRHYAPDAQLLISKGNDTGEIAGRIIKLWNRYAEKGIKVGILSTAQTDGIYRGHLSRQSGRHLSGGNASEAAGNESASRTEIICLGDRNDPAGIAATFFYALREMDRRKAGVILAEAIEPEGVGFAVMNRMIKAAGEEGRI